MVPPALRPYSALAPLVIMRNSSMESVLFAFSVRPRRGCDASFTSIPSSVLLFDPCRFPLIRAKLVSFGLPPSRTPGWYVASAIGPRPNCGKVSISRRVTARWIVASVVWTLSELASTLTVSPTDPTSSATSWRSVTPTVTSMLVSSSLRKPFDSAVKE